MTRLCRRTIEDMQLKGLAASTQEGYLNAVRQLAGYYHRSPDELSEEDLRQYSLYLTNERKIARSTSTVAICGIKFFYEQTLQRRWTSLSLLRPLRGRKLPVVLSRDEVRRALAAVRIPAYRACLTTIYACGLRANEGGASRWRRWTAAGCFCASMAKGIRIAMCRCPSLHSRCYALTGRRIARDRGCFRRRLIASGVTV
jgi:integrase